jgi:NADH-quinone oxidoreductase subunit N
MTYIDVYVLLPLIALAGSALTVMLQTAFYRCHFLSMLLALSGIAFSFAAMINVYPCLPHQVTALLIFDRYTFLYTGLILAASFVIVVLSYGYLEKHGGEQGEFYILMLLAVLGAVILINSGHFASLFLGLETLSVSLYALIAYDRSSSRGIEAGIKYLVLAAASAAFLLFGMALIYAELGTMSFHQIAGETLHARNVTILAGTAMIIVGAGFKLAVVPFHMWVSDVYEGAPVPVTAFIATVSKGAMFALILRYFSLVDARSDDALFLIFGLIAIASMFFGNILALLQNNVKRVLAYSSIAHLGYLLVAFLADRTLAFTAVTFYLTAYFITTLGAFGIITVLSEGQKEADSLEDYQGMASRRPWLTFVFIAMLLSLAGIPLTAGFIGKFYIVRAGAGSSLWLLVIILAINNAIGLFYYLRVIIALFRKSAIETAYEDTIAYTKISLTDRMVLSVLTLLLVWLGIYPALFIDLIRHFGSGFI